MTPPRGARRSALLLAGLVVAGLVPAPWASAAPTPSRLFGEGRYDTAAAVSASAFDPGVPVAFIATGQSAPDALAGGPAAAFEGGPVLLTMPGSLPDATRSELERLQPARIVVLGGQSAVSSTVEAALQELTEGSVDRLSGSGRYETAAAISAATFEPGVDRVYVATGLSFADALSAGPVAGGQGVPVLLTAPGSLPAATRAEIERLEPREIVVLGGAAAVWPSTEEALRPLASEFDRVSGSTRFNTSAAVSEAAFPDPVDTVYLATGADFPDALAGGPVAALSGSPLLLVQKDCVPASVQAEIARLDPTDLVILGGPGAVGAGVEQGTTCASGGPSVVEGPVAGGPDRDFAVEAPDFASEAHSDPWDYSNVEDEHLGTPQMSDAGTISGGQLRFTTRAPFPWIDPVPYLPGSQPLARDGNLKPIDTARYTHLSFRMFSSASVAGAVVWALCDFTDPTCQGATGFQLRPGWNTYDIRLDGTDPNSPAEWTGQSFRLRLVLGNESGVQIAVDWMRLRSTAPAMPFQVEPAAAGENELYWDSDGSKANNTPDNPGWGPLGRLSGTAASFPVEQFPPGAYRLFTRSAGVEGPYTEPLTILPRSRPVIDSPSLAGGQEYAATVRGDAWDFTSLSDASRIDNACNVRIVDGGVLAANNCPSVDAIDNPNFTLPQPGPIDGNTWHRVTIRIRYDGPFGVNGGATGGAVARLIWYVASDGQATDQNSYDIVLYPGWQTISFDLKTNPATDIVDEARKSDAIGWAGQQIVRLRLDPNEDVSARNWYVDHVTLTREDQGAGGFALQMRETSGLGGQSATVFLDDDRSGTNGTPVAGPVSVGGGGTSIPFSRGTLPPGRYWPYVVTDGPTGRAVRYADAPVILS